jgi:hypothetical protein
MEAKRQVRCCGQKCSGCREWRRPSRRPASTRASRVITTSVFGADLTNVDKASERRLVDITRGEQVEAEMDAFISKTDKQRRREEGDRPAEEMYAASVRLHHDKRQRVRAWEWLRYHERMIATHTATLEALIGRHRKEAERYAALLGVEPIDETSKVNGHKRGAA